MTNFSYNMSENSETFPVLFFHSQRPCISALLVNWKKIIN